MSEEKRPEKKKYLLDRIIGNRNYFIIMKLIQKNPMSYTELKDNKTLGFKTESSGKLAYYVRILRSMSYITSIDGLYILSFTGKRILKGLEIIYDTENITIENYPSCIVKRVSDPLSDEALLNEAVKRIIKEIKKIK